MMDIVVSPYEEKDIPVIFESFQKVNWNKPMSTFEQYFEEQRLGKRIVWIAHVNQQFAGYVTLVWQSQYQSFYKHQIPEIMDLNVLPNFRNLGVGSHLMETAERMARSKNDTVGIGVGLYQGYGEAQKLYVKRGYIPYGRAITYHYKDVEYGEKVILDDDLVLWFHKHLIEKTKLILITGASGTGKTTILRELEHSFSNPEIAVYYFDDIGIPTFQEMVEKHGSPEKWQEWATHSWIEKLSKVSDKNIIFFEGSFNAEFAIEKIKELEIKNYQLICLYTQRQIREQRLIERGQKELVSQDMENFSLILRENTLKLGGIVIDTSDELPKEIAEKIYKKS
jgi:GNAT superfamily N-acetyltransferase/dephospho-CoA kinase